jgi:PAS domain S-box-containing protein
MSGSAKRTVLLVEDEAIIAIASAKKIRTFGYEVVSAGTGEKAVEIALGERSPDIVLMDIDLGAGMDGTEAASRILARREMPIVFLSSHSEEEYLDRVKKITRFGYVIKNSGDFVLRSSIDMAFELFEANANYRKKVAELEESRNFLDITLHSIGDAVITTDLGGLVASMNATAERLTGWPAREARGLPLGRVFRIINAFTRREAENPVERVLREGGAVGLANHTVLVAKGGREYHISDSASPIKGEEGLIRGVILVFSDVTEKYEAEEKVRTSATRLKRAELASKSGNWEFHFDSKTAVASDGAQSIYGLHESVWKIAEIQKVPLGEYRPLLDRAMKALTEEGVPYEVDFKIKAVDTGEIKDIHSVAFFDAESRSVFGVIQDVTDGARIKEALEAGERNYREIFDSTSEAIFIHDAATGRILDVNEAVLRTYGFDAKEEILSRGIGELSAPEAPWGEAAAQAKIRLAVEEGPQTFEWKALKKDGTAFWMELAIRTTRIGGENRILAVGRDISERKYAEAAKGESEQKFRKLVQNMQVGVLLQGPRTEILLSNPAALELLGLDEDQLLGKSSFDPDWNVIREDGGVFPGAEHPVPQAIRSGAPVRDVVMGVYRPRTGDRAWLLVDAEPETDAGGAVAQVVCTFIDITKRKRAEESVGRLLAEKELILKEVHHRIKNNMNSVSGLLSLQAGSARDGRVAAALEDAGNRVKSMMLLYEKLYQSSAFNEISLSAYLPELVDEILGNFPNSGSVKVAVEVEDIVIDAKKASVLGIIANELLTNIMKYAFAGRPEGAIEVRASLDRGSDRVAMSVRDDGIGMPASVGFASSTGFGLTLVGMLAEQLNGDIRIERGGGTLIALEFKR